jgi:uncharacterized membrane protein YfcA
MLNTVPAAILAGILLGYLAGLGIGGGSLLVLWLTMALSIEQDTARAINLMFFITAAGSVSILRWRKGKLQLRKLLPGILAGCVLAAVTSLLRSAIDAHWLKRLFGILLLATGVRELFYRPRKAR